jgi:hypothetical protein
MEHRESVGNGFWSAMRAEREHKNRGRIKGNRRRKDWDPSSWEHVTGHRAKGSEGGKGRDAAWQRGSEEGRDYVAFWEDGGRRRIMVTEQSRKQKFVGAKKKRVVFVAQE